MTYLRSSALRKLYLESLKSYSEGKNVSKSVETRENGSRRVSLTLDTKSNVEQSHKKQVNINTIMAKVRRGQMVPVQKGSPLYGDFSGATDFHDAQNRILAAHDDFMQLPATVRNEFDNDPGKLIAYLNDPANASEAISKGLLPKPEPQDDNDANPPQTAPEAPKTVADADVPDPAS